MWSDMLIFGIQQVQRKKNGLKVLIIVNALLEKSELCGDVTRKDV